MSVLVVLALLACGFGMCEMLEAIANKNYVLGVASLLMSVLAGLCIGNLVWG